MQEDLSRFCCQNRECPDYGKPRGRQPDGLRPLRQGQAAPHALTAAPARPASPSARAPRCCGSQLTEGQALSIFEHLAERNGVRATARLVTVNRNTVVRYARLAGGHARQLHDELVALPPNTREVQFDEKWSFVFKKQEHCDPEDPADDHHGDWWDHVAIDAETRLVLAVVPGARDAEAGEEVVGEVKQRTGGRIMELMTSDDYPAYETAILQAYGQDIVTTPTGRPSRRMTPKKIPPPGLNYATVEKRREKGRVVEIITRVVFGTMAAVGAAPGAVAGQPVGQRVVPGAAERHGPAPQRAEGPQDLHVFEGLACARGDDLLHDLQLQLLLGCANADRTGRRGTPPTANACDGRGVGTDKHVMDDARGDDLLLLRAFKIHV